MTTTTDRGTKMLGYMNHTLYREATILHAVLDAIGGELDLIAAATDELRDQFFVQTATWGLDRWEEFVGLPIAPSGLADADRRERIIARLRGVGTVNIALVKNVAESYTYGDVDVDDVSTDPALPDYTIDVEFVSEAGIPANLEDLQTVLRELVPSHLDITYTFNYYTVAELSADGFTLGQWSGTEPGGPAGAPLTLAEFSEYR